MMGVIKKIALVIVNIMIVTGSIYAHEQEGGYFEPGVEFYPEEPIAGDFWDGIYYFSSGESWESEAFVVAPIIYDEPDGPSYGGYYIGDLVIPSEMYGLYGWDKTFSVVGVTGMYKNGLTSLYLPESIQWIGSTIESCRFLERVYLNASLKVLYGVRDCPKLSYCPLPLSLEEILWNSMCGIPINEIEFPESLKRIEDGCFCRLPNLKEIVFTDNIQYIGVDCFSHCAALEKVVLSSMPILNEGMFNECPAIKEVYVYADFPCEFPENCMMDTDKKQCTLYVPEGSEVYYANSDRWNEFGKIMSMSNTSVTDAGSRNEEWRAFAAHGLLVVDTAKDDIIEVYDISGLHAATVSASGRTELSLPRGVYVVKSHNKAIKIGI